MHIALSAVGISVPTLVNAFLFCSVMTAGRLANSSPADPSFFPSYRAVTSQVLPLVSPPDSGEKSRSRQHQPASQQLDLLQLEQLVRGRQAQIMAQISLLLCTVYSVCALRVLLLPACLHC
eukprot:COSAG01_NODE_1780_length_9247_cov_8.464145_10_plen_121_part_00